LRTVQQWSERVGNESKGDEMKGREGGGGMTGREKGKR